MDLLNKIVSVFSDDQIECYPTDPPFNPPNKIYSMVGELFSQLNYPIKDIVKPGDNVVIKPNLVTNHHPKGQGHVFSTVTHGSVLRPIIDLVYKALNGNGKICICDTPLEKADFNEILKITGIGEMVRYLREELDYPIEVLDLRQYKSIPLFGDKWKKKTLDGDPEGYISIDLKDESEFSQLDNKRQNYHTLADHAVNHYDPFTKEVGKPNEYHSQGKHEYQIAKTVLNADVIISVPKIKTHGKAGVTVNLKNMIGIISGKKYIPHHRPGSPPEGDAFGQAPPEDFVKHRFIRQKIARSISWLEYLIGSKYMKKIGTIGRKLFLERFWPTESAQKKLIQWGDWYGNDTLWRTIIDINKIVFYCDKNGKMSDTQQRKFFSVVDGIIGHEGNGPMSGMPIKTGIVLGGFSPVSVDSAAALIMGFDPDKIKSICKTKDMSKYFLGEYDKKQESIIFNTTELPNHKFLPPKGWKGHISL